MKIRITFKTPDAVADACHEFAWHQRDTGAALPNEVDDSEAVDYWRGLAEKACAPFFRYGEYVTVEVDIVAGTATVVR